MLRNYLVVALRSFYRHLTYSVINILGLTVGLTLAILIGLWVAEETSFDKSYPEYERIFQVLMNGPNANGEIKTSQSTTGLLAQTLETELPEVEAAGRADWGNSMLLRSDKKSFMQTGMWADPQIIMIFSLRITAGNSTNPLADPNSLVITRQTAEKFFPGENPIGKSFKVEERYDMTVAAVVEHDNYNKSLNFDFLMPYAVYAKENTWIEQWGNTNDKTYLKLKAGADPETMSEKVASLFRKNCESCRSAPFIQQLAEKHLYSRYENGKPSGGVIDYVRMFSFVAVFILVIACINYMNLATARSANRSREVGVRKVTGAHRTQLVLQFVGESFLLTAASVVLALVLVQISLPVCNELMSKKMTLDLFNGGFMLTLAAVTLLTSLVAGSYPAFFLSSFRPAAVLKGLPISSRGGSALRKGLVIFQFALSVMLMVGSMVVFYQTKFIRNKNLGFNRENVVVFDMHAGVYDNQDAFKTEALKIAGVESVTFGGQNPFSIGAVTSDVTWPGKSENDVVPFRMIMTDKDFIPTMQMQILDGSNFTDNQADSTHFIINETAARLIGFSEPVGSTLNVWGSTTGKVIGLVKDFHHANLHTSIEPIIIVCRPDNTWRAFARIQAASATQALEQLGALQKKFDPAYPFEYEFLDKSFEKEYTSENTIGKISMGFTAVAIFISCLGLYGLAAFMAERRTKEIGIRKVLGATVSQITFMLSRDFVKLVAISFALAAPVAWLAAREWLQTFAYHFDMTLTLLGAAAAVLFVTAIVSVGYQAIKSAIGNPVDALKAE